LFDIEDISTFSSSKPQRGRGWPHVCRGWQVACPAGAQLTENAFLRRLFVELTQLSVAAIVSVAANTVKRHTGCDVETSGNVIVGSIVRVVSSVCQWKGRRS
jgi:hypothetical protein